MTKKKITWHWTSICALPHINIVGNLVNWTHWLNGKQNRSQLLAGHFHIDWIHSNCTSPFSHNFVLFPYNGNTSHCRIGHRSATFGNKFSANITDGTVFGCIGIRLNRLASSNHFQIATRWRFGNRFFEYFLVAMGWTAPRIGVASRMINWYWRQKGN